MRYLVSVMVLFILGCHKNPDADKPPVNGWYEIEIRAAANIDCNLPEIVFNTGRQEAYDIIGDSRGVYIALGLPKVMYPVGTKLLVHIRKPTASEDFACTTLGTGWSHVLITELQ